MDQVTDCRRFLSNPTETITELDARLSSPPSRTTSAMMTRRRNSTNSSKGNSFAFFRTAPTTERSPAPLETRCDWDTVATVAKRTPSTFTSSIAARQTWRELLQGWISSPSARTSALLTPPSNVSWRRIPTATLCWTAECFRWHSPSSLRSASRVFQKITTPLEQVTCSKRLSPSRRILRKQGNTIYSPPTRRSWSGRSANKV